MKVEVPVEPSPFQNMLVQDLLMADNVYDFNETYDNGGVIPTAYNDNIDFEIL